MRSLPGHPWIVAICGAALGGCVFDAHDRSAQFTCDDGTCPGGDTCVARMCQAAGTMDGSVDARPFTCGAPGTATVGPSTLLGTTLGQASELDTMCAPVQALVGPETVYALDNLQIGHHVSIGFVTVNQMLASSTPGLYAYLLASCPASDRTPTCYGDELASTVPVVPLTVTVTTSPLYLVVDSGDPSIAGPFILNVTSD